MKIFIASAIVLSVLLYGVKEKDALSAHVENTVIIENDVIYGNGLPSRATTCKETRVHSAPGDSFPVLYILPVGETVYPREISRGNTIGWIMIDPAKWVRGLDLCPRGQ